MAAESVCNYDHSIWQLNFCFACYRISENQATFSPKFGKKLADNEQENIDRSTGEEGIQCIVTLNHKGQL